MIVFDVFGVVVDAASAEVVFAVVIVFVAGDGGALCVGFVSC